MVNTVPPERVRVPPAPHWLWVGRLGAYRQDCCSADGCHSVKRSRLFDDQVTSHEDLPVAVLKFSVKDEHQFVAEVFVESPWAPAGYLTSIPTDSSLGDGTQRG